MTSICSLDVDFYSHVMFFLRYTSIFLNIFFEEIYDI